MQNRLFITPAFSGKMRKLFKRIFDIVISLLLVILLLPVFLIIAVTIGIASKGLAIFKQQRAGKDGKPFTFYKFRTMKSDVDPFGPSPKTGDDLRLTRVGKFLREYSLDELPQLFNILKGDMSIVGPRSPYMDQMKEFQLRSY